MAFTYLDAAGPTGAPAVIIHRDQELPKVWRVLSTWEQDGMRGAWLEHAEDTYNKRRDIAQVVYGDARLYRPGNAGNMIGGAVSRLRCPSIVAYGRPWEVQDDHPDRVARAAHYAQRGQDIDRLDWYAKKLYEANGTPGPDDPFGGEPTPAIDAVPAPEPTDSRLIVEAVAFGAATPEVRLHPDSDWPDTWERRTHSRSDWAYQSPATWVPVEWAKSGPVRNERGVRMALTSWLHNQHSRNYEAEQGNAPSTSAPRKAPAPPQPPAGPPPQPGMARARWIGDRITAMTARESSGYLPHTRRRIAAHRALSIVAGYTPEDAENDGLTLSGGYLLHLEGLNAYAARAFAGEEDDHAVL